MAGLEPDFARCCRVEITSAKYKGGHLIVAAPGVVVETCFAFAWCVGKEWAEVKAWFKERPAELRTQIRVRPELFAWSPKE